MKNIYRISAEQHRNMKSGISWSKNSTILQARCATALPCESPTILTDM